MNIKDAQGREIIPTKNCIHPRCSELSLPNLDKCKKHWESELELDKSFRESGFAQLLKKVN